MKEKSKARNVQKWIKSEKQKNKLFSYEKG